MCDSILPCPTQYSIRQQRVFRGRFYLGGAGDSTTLSIIELLLGGNSTGFGGATTLVDRSLRGHSCVLRVSVVKNFQNSNQSYDLVGNVTFFHNFGNCWEGFGVYLSMKKPPRLSPRTQISSATREPHHATTEGAVSVAERGQNTSPTKTLQKTGKESDVSEAEKALLIPLLQNGVDAWENELVLVEAANTAYDFRMARLNNTQELVTKIQAQLGWTVTSEPEPIRIECAEHCYTDAHDLPIVLKLEEAANLLRVSEAAMYAMIERNKIGGLSKIGRSIFFMRDVFLEWLAKGGTMGGGR